MMKATAFKKGYELGRFAKEPKLPSNKQLTRAVGDKCVQAFRLGYTVGQRHRVVA